MAYAFDKSLSLLGGQKPDDQQDKANIFAPQQGAQAQGSGNGLGLTDQGGSSSAGDLSGAGGSSGTSRASGAQSPGVSQSAAYAANLGKQASPASFSGITNEISGKKDALQKEADSYVANSSGPSKLTDQETTALHGAVDPTWGASHPSGDETGFVPGGQAGGAGIDDLNHWSSVVGSHAEQVNPFKSTVDTTDPNIDILRTDAGVQQLLRRQGGAEYGAGDAAFDQSLLARDTGFQKQRQDALRSYDDLQKQGASIGGDTTKKAQEAANLAHSQYLDDLHNKLSGLQTDYRGAADDQEKALEDAASARTSALMLGAGDAYRGQLKSFQNDPANAALSQYAEDPGFSAYYNQFAKNNFDPNAEGFRDYLNQDQADVFNRIGGLLGQGGGYTAGKYAGGVKDSDLVSYDTNAMNQDILSRATAGKTTADQRAQDAKDQAAKAAAVSAQADKNIQDRAATAAKEKETLAPKAPGTIGVQTEPESNPPVLTPEEVAKTNGLPDPNAGIGRPGSVNVTDATSNDKSATPLTIGPTIAPAPFQQPNPAGDFQRIRSLLYKPRFI